VERRHEESKREGRVLRGSKPREIGTDETSFKHQKNILKIFVHIFEELKEDFDMLEIFLNHIQM
jgi:hypothetical protein